MLDSFGQHPSEAAYKKLERSGVFEGHEGKVVVIHVPTGVYAIPGSELDCYRAIHDALDAWFIESGIFDVDPSAVAGMRYQRRIGVGDSFGL
mgnify:CR=1 FL=1